jgi:hypothetical protein
VRNEVTDISGQNYPSPSEPERLLYRIVVDQYVRRVVARVGTTLSRHEFRKHRPHVALDLREEDPVEHMLLVRQRELDCAFVRLPQAIDEDSRRDQSRSAEPARERERKAARRTEPSSSNDGSGIYEISLPVLAEVLDRADVIRWASARRSRRERVFL